MNAPQRSAVKTKVARHFFIADSLDDLDRVVAALRRDGIERVQIHVLTNDDANAVQHPNLPDVTSIMKKDVIRSGELGLAVGLIAAIVVLLTAYLTSATTSIAGWAPWIFLAVLLLGFCTWEGGFIGIQRTNHNFARFKERLAAGQHILFVDITAEQTPGLRIVTEQFPGLVVDSVENGTPQWIMRGQKEIPHFLRETLP